MPKRQSSPGTPPPATRSSDHPRVSTPSADEAAVDQEWKRIESDRVAEEVAEAREDLGESAPSHPSAWLWGGFAAALLAGVVFALVVNVALAARRPPPAPPRPRPATVPRPRTNSDRASAPRRTTWRSSPRRASARRHHDARRSPSNSRPETETPASPSQRDGPLSARWSARRRNLPRQRGARHRSARHRPRRAGASPPRRRPAGGAVPLRPIRAEALLRRNPQGSSADRRLAVGRDVSSPADWAAGRRQPPTNPH